jgi:predicted phage baseplate assembly protein
MEPRDRRETLIATGILNGIDFVEVVGDDQATLRVHFLNAVELSRPLAAPPTIAGGETIPVVLVNPIDDARDWSMDGDHLVLTLTVPAAGDFSDYTLTINSPKLDRFFSQATFSFKANCPSDFDCAAPAPACPPLTGDAPPIDYLAKDFQSFVTALSDFSALRYPLWVERSEADFGMMILEAMAALADDLSYAQDRVAAEATLPNATQRRSVVRHARLVDYEPGQATAARVLLQFDVTGTTVPFGLAVAARQPDGSVIAFETGTGLIDPSTLQPAARGPFAVSPRWNRGILPYWWDDSRRCLNAGATQMWVLGHGFGFQAGQWLLIDTSAETTADPPLRELVQLTADGSEDVDLLFTNGTSPPSGTPVTLIQWGRDTAPKQAHDLTRTVLAGNLIPATQAQTSQVTFVVDPPSDAPLAVRNLPRAVVRTGPNGTPQYLFTLPARPVAWLQPNDPGILPIPEILVNQPTSQGPQPWRWLRRLLDAEPFDSAFTLDAVKYSAIGQDEAGDAISDYDGDGGDTIRFGDGTFGDIPPQGAQFEVTYRVGGGLAGNVSPDTINQLGPEATGILSVTNPLAASGGNDPEPSDLVKQRAPQAFQAVQYRAVRPEDYTAAAETLPWVLRAGTAFRWTGSWLTVFTTPDPLDSETMSVAEHLELINLLNRERMAGYECYAPDPDYVSIDLIVEVCTDTDAFRGDVEAGILAALSTADSVPPTAAPGFFNHDHFSFGDPLEPSAIQRAVQAVTGVAGVLCVRYRRRGISTRYTDLTVPLEVGFDQILRVDNDPSRPERGSIKVIVKGGK